MCESARGISPCPARILHLKPINQELSTQLESDDFWDNAKSAADTSQRHSFLQAQVSGIIKLEEELDEQQSLLQMAKEEDDGPAVDECEAILDELKLKAHSMAAEAVLSSDGGKVFV